MMRGFTVLCSAMMLMLLSWGSAFAEAPPSSPARSASLTCSEFNDATGQIIGGLKGAAFGVIVPCISKTVEIAAQKMTTEMVIYFRPIFYAFLTLVLIFHGVTAVQGEGQMGPRTFLLLLKMSAVWYFVEALGGSVPNLISIADIYDIMDATADIMADAILPGEGSRGFTCDWQQFMPTDNRPANILWAQMDCALGKILGFAMGAGGQPSMILAASVLGMLGGFFFGGTFGLAVFFAAVGFLVSLLMFVLRVGFAFLNAYLLVAIYVILAPLFIPLALLRPTTQYFQNWTTGIMGAVMMPIIVTTYSLFALLVFDKVLFSDNSTLKQLIDYDFIKDAQQGSKPVGIGTWINDSVEQAKRAQQDQLPDGGASQTQNRDVLAPALAGANKIQWQQPNLEITRSGLSSLSTDAVAREKEIYSKLLIDLTKMLLVCFVMITGWKQVMQVMAVLSGGSAAAGAALQPQGPEQGIINSFNQSKAAMNQAMITKDSGPGGATGTAFIEQLVPTITAGTGQFLSGVTR